MSAVTAITTADRINAVLATVPDPRVTDPDSFLAVADANLLKAKADGRNRYRD